MTLPHITEWASLQAFSLLPPLGNRWLHVQGVVKQAESVGKMLDQDDRALLVAAAYLHDIGYAPSLMKTGFHPLDGATYLQSQNQHRLASLVAYHSEAQFEAHLRSLYPSLDQFPREYSSVADALTYCDMTTNSLGQHVTFQERIADIFNRYPEKDIVHQAISQALPSLTQVVDHTQEKLDKWEVMLIQKSRARSEW